MSLPDSKSNVTSFVCINGQLERLELENKFMNLLLPIRQDIGGTVDIALVVSENEALYTKAEVSQPIDDSLLAPTIGLSFPCPPPLVSGWLLWCGAGIE